MKLAVILALFLAIIPFSAALSMESANYKIDKDSVNVGGADSGQSASYNLKDTAGEIGTGESASASYIISAGYRAMLETTVPTFTFSLRACLKS